MQREAPLGFQTHAATGEPSSVESGRGPGWMMQCSLFCAVQRQALEHRVSGLRVPCRLAMCTGSRESAQVHSQPGPVTCLTLT